ncbi:CAF1-domain-containing protein [Polychaeton citri CBS 116435]|uniref:CAF1-domain-containing protein n=1 Tax=Polychaeton citri CBS 116435 TaxID=1314669 RepID=A0A9P4Q1J3_9PEZI|nr:CAF1-domain-containing protein [Polychaeton citri CBS 116435]
MEVDKTAFYPVLLDVLTDISEALFVTFDLELSGVCSKAPAGGGKGPGRPSLQERYTETKEAAERYEILQFGLTCVQQDVQSGKYVLKPYNFYINPIIEEWGIEIERIFSYQSGAVEFLLKNNFDMARPFTHGVPYMSRPETRLAKERFAKRNIRADIADIQIKPSDTEKLAFLAQTRAVIDTWINDRRPDALDFVNVSEEVPDGVAPAEMSRFKKRLVHQLVRAEYPALTTLSRRNFVQIIHFNQDREDRIALEKKQAFGVRLNRQKGFRWIIEALVGSDLSHLDLMECARDPETGRPVFADMDEYRARFARAHARIRNKPKVLIGHNCFLDLVYVYKHFIGALPASVEDFSKELHKLWPMLVDTKYMATHNCGDINPSSSLEELSDALKGRATPVLELHVDHGKYEEGVELLHEAGYDSYLTAQVATRLSSKLELEGAYIVTEALADTDDSGDGGVQISSVRPSGTGHQKGGAVATDLTAATEKLSIKNKDIDSDVHEQVTGHPIAAEPFLDSRKDSSLPSTLGRGWNSNQDPSFSTASLTGAQKSQDLDKLIKGGVPSFHGDFWRVYGNKLRVFGTDEGVCLLDHSARKEVELRD